MLNKNKYIKENDEIYCALLSLARVSDNTFYGIKQLEYSISVLNNLPAYVKIHKRIIPLLNAKAQTLNIFDKLNVQVQSILKNSTQKGVVTELAKQQQFEQIYNELSKANISVILLKSMAFNKLLYGSNAPRLSNDIDILVKEKDWEKVRSIIEKIMIYTPKTRHDVFGDAYEISYKPKLKIGDNVDLHKALTHPQLFNIKEESLWKTSECHPVYNNENIRILSAECALLHQAIHAYTDMNFCKYNLIDSNEILQQYQPNMLLLIQLSKDWGACTPLYFLLKNCIDTFGNNIDNTIMNSIRPKKLKLRLAVALLNSSFAQPTTTHKSKRYRLNQILSQFVFVSNYKNVLRFQWLFIKTFIKQKIV